MRTLRIGTRQSQLALWQANYVRDGLLEHHPDISVELVGITTQGDKTLDVPLARVGGKGLFLKELEQALLTHQIDLAVHSMKDVTVSLPEGLAIPVICEREDPRDAFVSNHFESVDQLPPDTVVGTCSLRRQCLLRYRFPELRVENLRGNVNTRLRRLDEGDFDAIILAAAGLKRLDMSSRIRSVLPVELSLPAVGQGAVGIECREDDALTRALIQPLDHPATRIRVSAERAANEALDGGCHVPLAVFATYTDAEQGQLAIRGMVGQPDGGRLLFAEASGSASDPVALGREVAEDLLRQGAGEILDQVYAQH